MNMSMQVIQTRGGRWVCKCVCYYGRGGWDHWARISEAWSTPV